MQTSRRALLRQAMRLGCSLLGGALLASCHVSKPLAPAEKVIPETEALPLTRVVTEVIVVETTPRIIEKVVTPAPTKPTVLVADVLDASWSRFAQSVTPLFEETFPGIRIRWRSLSDWATYPQRIATLSASGQLGDLIELPNRTLTLRWARQGVLQDLTPILEASHYETSRLLPSGLAAYRWEERQLGLPFVCHGGMHLLLYDPTPFEAANIPPLSDAQDLETFSGLLRAIARPTEGLYGCGIPWELPAAYPLLRAFGADLFDASGHQYTLDDANGARCLQWLDQLPKQGIIPSPATVERGLTAMWQRGRLGALLTTLWRALELTHLQPERPLKITPLPPASEHLPSPAIASGTGYGVPATSPNAAQALQWIGFMLTQEMGVRIFLEGFGGPGCRRSAWEDPRILERFPACAQLAPIVAQADSEHVPADLETERYYALWNHHIRRLLDGESTPEQTLAALSKEIEARL